MLDSCCWHGGRAVCFRPGARLCRRPVAATFSIRHFRFLYRSQNFHGSSPPNLSHKRRDFFVGRPMPLLQENCGGGGLYSRAFSYSDAGVRSSRYSGTNFAPTRLAGKPMTFTVRWSKGSLATTISPGRKSRDGFTLCASINTCPFLQAVAASERVL